MVGRAHLPHRTMSAVGLPLMSDLGDPVVTAAADDTGAETLQRYRYQASYGLLEGPMASVQVVLIDSDLDAPPDGIETVDRRMLSNDPAHPRLVPYYVSTAQVEESTEEDDDEGKSSEGDED